jgi:hypothetical protein
MKIFLLFLALSASTSAIAQNKPVIECGESKGVRFDAPSGNVAIDTDEAPRHFFLTIDLKASKISLLWPESKTSDGRSTLPSYTAELLIVSATENQISALDIDQTGDMVGVYSLYPKEKVIYHTQHRYQAFSGGSPNNTSLWAKCKM